MVDRRAGRRQPGRRRHQLDSLRVMSNYTSGTSGGTVRYSVPQAARYLGISERAVRKRIQTGSLAAERDGRQWIVFLPAVPDAVPGGTGSGTDAEPAEPIEAGYRVTPAELEQAIARTGERYVADIAALYDRVEASYREIIDAKDQTIAELRRRADDAEHERDQLRRELEHRELSSDSDNPASELRGLFKLRREFKRHTAQVDRELAELRRERLERPESAPDGPHAEAPTAAPQTPQRGPQRRWWRFWEQG